MFLFLYTGHRRLAGGNGSGQLNCKPPLGPLFSGSGIPANLEWVGRQQETPMSTFGQEPLEGCQPQPRTGSGIFWLKQAQTKAWPSVSLVGQLMFEPVS